MGNFVLFYLILFKTIVHSSVFFGLSFKTIPNDFGVDAFETNEGYKIISQVDTEAVGYSIYEIAHDMSRLNHANSFVYTDGVMTVNSVTDTIDGSFIISGRIIGSGTGIYVSKHSSSGSKIWSKRIRHASEDLHNPYVIEDKVNDTYSTIVVACGIDFGIIESLMLVKFSLDGDRIWSKMWGNEGNAEGTLQSFSICKDCMSGETNPLNGYLATCRNSEKELAVVLFDNEGERIWASEVNKVGENFLVTSKVIQSSNTDIYTASVWSTGETGVETTLLLTRHGLSSGELSIAKKIETPAGSFYGGSTVSRKPGIAETYRDKGIIIVGSYNDSNSDDNLIKYPWIMKLTSDGNHIWSRRLFSSGGLIGVRRSEKSQNILVSGMEKDGIAYNPYIAVLDEDGNSFCHSYEDIPIITVDVKGSHVHGEIVTDSVVVEDLTIDDITGSLEGVYGSIESLHQDFRCSITENPGDDGSGGGDVDDDDGGNQGGMIAGIVLGVVFSPILLLALLCCFLVSLLCCVLICVFCFVLCLAISGSAGYLGLQVLKKAGENKKVSYRDSFARVIDQEMGEQKAAEIKINKSLFEIKYEQLKVLKIIGKGGSNSIVFHCKWGDDNEVAFKCFQTVDLFGTQSDFNEFEKEGVGIVMEFCPNGDLKVFLGKNGDYEMKQRFRILREVSDGMCYLHERNVIHRDLKSENILLDSDYHAKIIDFGLSKVTKRMSVSKTKNVGTCFYMAPEVVMGNKYTEKCDVFSFSILAWEVVTNCFSPYGAVDGSFNIEYKVANDRDYRPEVEKVSEILKNNKNCCEGFVRLMRSCWSHESADRPGFEKIKSMVRELEEGL